MVDGLCECGCGEKSPLAPQSCTRFGWVRNEPLRFIRGHNGRKKISPTVDKKTGCWKWNLAIDKLGYGVKAKGRGHVRAHRYFYEQKFGPIPEGLEIDHLCRVRSCVNPNHLEAVTHTENMRRARHVKLSLEKALEIRSLLKTGFSLRKIGELYGVSSRSVLFIKQNRTWKGDQAAHFSESVGHIW